MQITELIPPLEPAVAEELIVFWERIFGISFAQLRGVLAGEESEYNRDFIYVVRESGRLAGTCHLTVGVRLPAIGGVGEVAVAPEFRCRGIARTLCIRSWDTFRDRGGAGLFLATDMENAARVYHRIGWRRIDGSNAMLLTNNDQSPDKFLAAHLNVTGGVTVAPANPGDRTAVIPLLMSPHDSCVLDANVGILSPKYALQSSCMGLYPQYQYLRDGGRGEWFAARAADGRVVGLASVRLDENAAARIDGFAHQCKPDALDALISQATDWAADRSATLLDALLATCDVEKQSRFESAGFQLRGQAAPLHLNGCGIQVLHWGKSFGERQNLRADFAHLLQDSHLVGEMSGIDSEKTP